MLQISKKSLKKEINELKRENTFSLTKDTKIQTLEGIIMKLGTNPDHVNSLQNLIKIKDENIQTLRKKLKFPEHAQTQKLDVMEKEKEWLLSVMIEQNKHME